ncbi:MAG: hypothetical protein F9K44_02795 [Hyphomicrobiaceae bacterium]|nr:MAG: hypothetical protein F9K44_02795 [Hyphomicrobiaceae bacterium]
MRSPSMVLLFGLAITVFAMSSASPLLTQKETAKKQRVAKHPSYWCSSAEARPARPDAAQETRKQSQNCQAALASR